MHVTNAPLGASNKMMGYILELPAKPVAVVDASSKATGNGPLSMTRRSNLIGQIKAAQSPVATAVHNIGGVVTAKFQTVYNGMGVRIPARDAYKLASLQGVKAIYAMHTFKPANVNSVPLINGPETWDGVDGFTGTGMKIGDIDTGLDYTHADFGGPGTVNAWNCALAHSTLDPSEVNCGEFGGNLGQYFGSGAPKVKGGTDLVGNCYDAAAGTPYNANGIDCRSADPLTPQPDNNPLDCNSHGTHTAGTLAGFGVDADGNTYDYTQPNAYNASTISDNNWTVGPGMAPNASLYAIRVFGCSGVVGDDVLIAAMDWAVNNGMDVINMSLGADFGSASDADSVAASNTAKEGVIVVSASGNSGNAPYITSSPAAGTNGIAVAANDSNPSFPAASLTLTTNGGTTGDAGTLTAIDANGFDFSSMTGNHTLTDVPPSGEEVFVNGVDSQTKDNGSISLGCSVAEDEGANGGNPLPEGTIIVVTRGVCARVAKAVYGQEAGAAGVIMVNSSSDYPPFEGKITSNPDDGTAFTVTIPFLGVPSTDGATLLSASGGTVDLENTDPLANPTYLDLASFSSFGPSAGTYLKPEITAPGVSVDSAGMGTGNQALIDSGTSMATPHVAGEAALVKEAHPTWRQVQFYKDAILNTANPINVGSTDGTADGSGWSLRGAGAGEADAYNATHTQVVASGFPNGMSSLNFTAPAMKTDYSHTEFIRLRNFGSSASTFDLADDGGYSTGNDHSIAFSDLTGSTISSVTVPARGTASVGVTLSVPLSSAVDPFDQWFDWNCPFFSDCGNQFDDLGGLITLTPSGESNSGIGLTVPYYAVPTAASAAKARINTTQLKKNGTANALVANRTGGTTGYADWFSLGATSPVSTDDLGSADLLSAGVQSFPGDEFAYFALKVSKPWTNPAEDEFDVYVDVNGDGAPDYDVLSANFQALNANAPVTAVTAVCPFDANGNLVKGDCTIDNLTGAYFNGTTMELPVNWDQLCLGDPDAADDGDTPDPYPCIGDNNAPISYSVFSFDRNGGSDAIGSYDSETNTLSPGADPFDLFNPVFSNNFEDVVDPGSSTLDPTTVDSAAWTANPQEGFLVLMQNNRGSHNKDESVNIPFSLGETVVTSRHHG
ncbi:MAG: S8 family serine peptidase [Gaiellaceae bacterium]